MAYNYVDLILSLILACNPNWTLPRRWFIDHTCRGFHRMWMLRPTTAINIVSNYPFMKKNQPPLPCWLLVITRKSPLEPNFGVTFKAALFRQPCLRQQLFCFAPHRRRISSRGRNVWVELFSGFAAGKATWFAPCRYLDRYYDDVHHVRRWW